MPEPWRRLSERITRLLEEAQHPLSAEEIAAILGLDPRTGAREVYAHLSHVARTVWRSNGRKQVFMEPPSCRACGYMFKGLDKPRKPSKCPMCGSQRIEPPFRPAVAFITFIALLRPGRNPLLIKPPQQR